MRLATVLTSALLAFSVLAVQAGTLHPMLEARLGVIRDGEPVSVIVHMTEQAPIAELNAELKAERSTRAERHRRVVEALKTAALSQETLTEHLESSKGLGGVIGYTPYWISNLLVVYGTKDAIYEIAARGDVDFVEPNFTVSLIEPVGERLDESDEEAQALR
ncbi:MAG: hypothetical protein ABIH26_07995, partial [Candidatus Eisenbacteria bacterium]